MKKSIFFLSVLVFFAFAPQSNAQNDCGDNARSYVNANITTNGIRAITGAKMNVALNKIIDAIICRDSLATILQDSLTIEIEDDSILSFTIFGQTVKDTIRNVTPSTSATYLTYVALIQQTNTDAPDLIELENTLGVTITASYEGVGIYGINASSPIFGETTTTTDLSINWGNTPGFAQGGWNNDSQIIITTSDITGTQANSIIPIGYSKLEIRVYL